MGLVQGNVAEIHVYVCAQLIPRTQNTNTLWYHIVQSELRTFYNPLNAVGLSLKNGTMTLYYHTLLDTITPLTKQC